MSSSDFTQRRRQERQVQAAAHAEEVQHGTHGKEERAETADQMLDRLLEEMNTPGQEHGGKNRDKIIRLDPKITDGKGSWRKWDGTDRCWGKWSPSAGCGGPSWSGANKLPRILLLRKKSQDQCPYHLKNLLDLKWHEEKEMAVCCLV